MTDRIKVHRNPQNGFFYVVGPRRAYGRYRSIHMAAYRAGQVEVSQRPARGK